MSLIGLYIWRVGSSLVVWTVWEGLGGVVSLEEEVAGDRLWEFKASQFALYAVKLVVKDVSSQFPASAVMPPFYDGFLGLWNWKPFLLKVALVVVFYYSKIKVTNAV